MKNYGLLEKLGDARDYLFGDNKVPYIPYNESGDWEAYLPKYENQTTRLGHETSGCTAHGSLNQSEIFYKFLYGGEPNYSERFTYLNADINPQYGQDPQITYEAIRKHGLVDERYLPMTDTIVEYTDKSDLTKSILAKGQNWLVEHEFKHDLLWRHRPENALELMKQAIKTCPLGCAVTAWNQKNGVFVDNGGRNNHWCVIYKIDDAGIHVWDSYDHSKKILSLDHNIGRVKRIWINKKSKRASRRHVGILQEILNLFMQKRTLVDVCESHLGTDASPNDAAPDELACADTVSTILNETYGNVPNIVSTIRLDTYLRNPQNGFEEVTELAPGVIIISPTEGARIGHVGICMADMTIASNDSGIVKPENKGKFLKNYTLETWQKRYTEKLKLKTSLYRKVV